MCNHRFKEQEAAEEVTATEAEAAEAAAARRAERMLRLAERERHREMERQRKERQRDILKEEIRLRSQQSVLNQVVSWMEFLRSK